MATDEIVTSVVTAYLKTPPSDDVVAQAIEVLRGEASDLPGFVTGQILVSTDAKTLAIVTRWRDIHAWSASRYDKRVGKMLEDCLANSTLLGFELFREKARFVGPEGGGAANFAPRPNSG